MLSHQWWLPPVSGSIWRNSGAGNHDDGCGVMGLPSGSNFHLAAYLSDSDGNGRGESIAGDGTGEGEAPRWE